MSSKGHSNTTDLNKPYEENVIQLKGILGFGIGLFGLIVVTFALMWALLNVLRDYRMDADREANPIPAEVRMNDKERLPPEPRLQLAPGFGVDTEHGRVNLELREPQAEYREVHKQWAELWEKGQKDPRTGAVTLMPIDEASEKLVHSNLKAKTGPEAEELLNHSKLFLSDASSGRVASLRRR
jgi:hypothetical protein